MASDFDPERVTHQVAMARDSAAREGGALLVDPTLGPAGDVALVALDLALTIGRDPDTDIVVHGTCTSREHAELRCRGGRWVYQDVSKYGTLLRRKNSERKLHHKSLDLEHGDELRFGPSPWIRFELYEQPARDIGDLSRTLLDGEDGVVDIAALRLASVRSSR